ncbi:MAG TPA: 2-oxoacid:acceptor oxidoreductase family protein, partial [Candidatus Deferrimicrobium sp.]|nr:2-oxoacid:acceptor oxidoreductase family protein [Candidatus Deferrimicrobium sp.]
YILAGFGGQGVLLVGKAIAQAGMLAGKKVTWIPAYGPEMRGGTANCSVIISDKKIGSPTVAKPDVALVMNTASYEKFLGSVLPGGTLFVNSSIIPELKARDDIKIYRVPVNDIAHELGNAKVANIVMLGVMQALAPSVPDEVMDQALMELGGKKPALAELNARALAAGKEFARSL